MIFKVLGERATIVGGQNLGGGEICGNEQLEVNGQQLDNLYFCFLHAFRRWLIL